MLYVYGVALLFKIDGKNEVRSIMFTSPNEYDQHEAKERAMLELKVSGNFGEEFNKVNLVSWSASNCTFS